MYLVGSMTLLMDGCFAVDTSKGPIYEFTLKNPSYNNSLYRFYLQMKTINFESITYVPLSRIVKPVRFHYEVAKELNPEVTYRNDLYQLALKGLQ
jgi:hypothetical protein